MYEEEPDIGSKYLKRFKEIVVTPDPDDVERFRNYAIELQQKKEEKKHDKNRQKKNFLKP
ncbi:MAG: hypothetical protein ACLFPQ_04545 [Candidatus Woesearchaeota archaeon]